MVRSLSTFEMVVVSAVALAGAIALFNGALPESWLAVAIAFASMLVIWIVVRDARDFIIPDRPVVALALVGATVRLSGVADPWQPELITLLLDGAMCGGAFLIIREGFFRIRGYDGMGFGDVKLAVACGILVGMPGFAWSVFAASAIGLVVALILPVLRPGMKLDRLPFGALLAPACWLVWVMQLWSGG
jgi:leader peptidase (prepilin peptidase)/N-methyltransferase